MPQLSYPRGWGACLPCAHSTHGWPSFFLRPQAWVPGALPCSWGQSLGSRWSSRGAPWPWVSLPAQPLEESWLWPFCWFLRCLTVTGMACLSRRPLCSGRGVVLVCLLLPQGDLVDLAGQPGGRLCFFCPCLRGIHVCIVPGRPHTADCLRPFHSARLCPDRSA